MNAPYDNDPERRPDASGGRRQPEDAYTRDTYGRYGAGSGDDDPYAGVDDLLGTPDPRAPYGYPAQPGQQPPPQQYAPQPQYPQQYPQEQYPQQQYADPRAYQDPAAQPQPQPQQPDPYQQQQAPQAGEAYPPQYPQQQYAGQPQQQLYDQEQQPAAPAPYDPRDGGYSTAQFFAGQFEQTAPPYDPQLYAPAPAPPQPGYPATPDPYTPDPYAAQQQGYAPPAPEQYAGGQYGGQQYAGQQYAGQPQPLYDQEQGGYPGGMPAAPPQPQPGPYPGPGMPPAPAMPPPSSAPVAAPPAPAAQAKGGGLMKSSALMAAGTMVSRLLGFVRNLVISAAIGLNVLGDAYSAANTLPTLLYILIAGGALNAVFVPQLVRSMKNDEDGGNAYASRLLTLMMCVLAALTLIAVAAAPLLVRLVSEPLARNPDSFAVTVAFARYCLPTIFFMGVHVVLGQILNARNKFGAMMWTPVLNNIVIITTFGLFLWVYGPFRTTNMDPSTIPDAGVRLLGIGTLLGLTVQALAMIPYMRDAGFKFRPRFDWRGHGLGKAARLARWTFLFVLANQAGLLVTTQLATAAGNAAVHKGHSGAGLAAYQNALQIWQLPQAAITVSLMTAVLPRISRAAADGDAAAVRDDISYGLRTSAVAIVPCAFLFLALGPQIGTTLFGAGTGTDASRSLGYILMAFSLGLIPFSAQYVMLRGFYAYEDTRTPFYNTVWVAGATAALSGLAYLVLPAQWAVTGMAAGYGIAYLVGVVVASGRLRRRLGDLDGARVRRTYLRLCAACVPAAVVAYLLGTLITHAMQMSWISAVAGLIVGGIAFLVLFVAAGKALRINEMTALVGAIRSKLGR